MEKGYKALEVWKLAREVVIEVHAMTLKLPKFEIMKKDHKLESRVPNMKLFENQ